MLYTWFIPNVFFFLFITCIRVRNRSPTLARTVHCNQEQQNTYTCTFHKIYIYSFTTHMWLIFPLLGTSHGLRPHWRPVLGSAKRAPANVRRLNNISYVIFIVQSANVRGRSLCWTQHCCETIHNARCKVYIQMVHHNLAILIAVLHKLNITYT